jgi:FlaA1/EpsC-like NDP-sugar epimerase
LKSPSRDTDPLRTAVRPRPWTPARIGRGTLKYGGSAVIDGAAVFTTYLLAVGVRTGGRDVDLPEPVATVVMAAVAGVLQVGANILFDVYWRDWSVAALEDLVALVKASALVAVALVAFNFASDSHAIPMGAVVTGAGLVVLVEAALKLRPRWPQIARAALGRAVAANIVIVVGAGRTGQLLARDLADGSRGYRIGCFVDDHPAKWGTYVRGVKVAGGIEDLAELIRRYAATSIVIAIPNPPGPLVRRVAEQCGGAEVRIRAVSGFGLHQEDLSPLRPIGVEEFLARDPVELDMPQARAYIDGRTVLVTGAAGSIGSELSRQVAALGPRRLLLLDANESGLHDLQLQLSPLCEVTLLLGDVRDSEWLEHAFASQPPQIVFHAAAYKHVSIAEQSPLATITTNVVGLRNALDAARSSGVERFVFISSDKAVAPVNVYAMTKRCGELLTLAYALRYGGNFSVVRFGNVLGSAGSVIPLFSRQIDAGGPVTVTHPEATRYFMTITEAAGLVIVAGALASGGALFVLDMGAPVSINELALNMIRLRGLRVGTDVEIEYVGLRPGEKLHEQLLFPEEISAGTIHPRVSSVSSPHELQSVDGLRVLVQAIERAASEHDHGRAIALLREAVTKGALVHPEK